MEQGQGKTKLINPELEDFKNNYNDYLEKQNIVLEENRKHLEFLKEKLELEIELLNSITSKINGSQVCSEEEIQKIKDDILETEKEISTKSSFTEDMYLKLEELKRGIGELEKIHTEFRNKLLKINSKN